MAMITKRKLKRENKTRNTVHKEVFTTYTSFQNYEEKLFQIDTYGSDTREMKGKISQSFQFDKETAEHLIELLKLEFDI